MSSLWTPGGEHRVPRAPADAGAGAPPGSAGGGSGGGVSAPGDSGQPARRRDEGDEGNEALAEQMRELEEQLLAAPAADVVANHCYGLFELGALHLGAQPPQLAEARVAIDAFAAVVETLGDRLGQAAPTLREALANIRLAFVQIAQSTTGAGEGG